jgi:hypothetical protein
MQKLMRMFGLLALLLLESIVSAQDATPTIPTPVPTAYQVQGFTFSYQGMNNCGPATLTTALTHFGYTDDQYRAARWLKPNDEDKNVSPAEMVEFVNAQVPELNVFALHLTCSSV